MRAVIIDSYGDPSVLHLSEIEDPVAGPGQVRIKTAAAAVNPVDLGTRSGAAAAAVPDPVFPMVLGWDVAGTIDQVGEGVARFAPGDRAIAMSLWFVTRTGTYADYVVLDEGACAKAPDGVDDVAAATIPLNGLTAWSVLAVAGAQPGDRLLVTGAAGGVGGFVVELASRRGLVVTGFARTKDLETVRALGAAEAVDDLEAVSGFDYVVDTTANPALAAPYVAKGGRLLTLSGRLASTPEDRTVKAVGVRNNVEALETLAQMAGNGELTLRVADVLPFEQAAEAHSRFASGGVRGRLVLQA